MATIEITVEERLIAIASVDAFNVYAGIDGKEDVSEWPTLRRLQIEHLRWQENTFDDGADTSLAVMLLGIVEEACFELPVAMEAGDNDEVFDSLGDILIYACAVCTSLRLDFMVLARNFSPDHLVQPQGLDGIMNVYKSVGMLAHVVGKHRQKTRGYDDIAKVREDGGASLSRLFAAIQWLCFSGDWEASVVFEDVLSRVMKRDWKTNKLTGQTSLPLDA